MRISSALAIRMAGALTVVVGSAMLVSSTDTPAFTEADKAYYADQNMVNFVRPGLVLKVLSADIAQDGTIKARVKMTDPKGLPLDKDGITTPGAISPNATTGLGSPSLIAAYIPKGQTQFVSYTTRTQTSPITKVVAVQAGADSGGAWEKVADGEYLYTFKTKAPASIDRSATHAIGLYGNRNLTEFDMGIQLDDDVYYFVPDGSSKPQPRDLIKTATCNKCHGNMHFHGETGRKSVEMCTLCHTPQTTDPDTGNTVDLPVMVHKIHMGNQLPSVKAGKPYQIIGNAQSMNDFSTVGFPSDPGQCEVCHEQDKGATQQAAYLKPNQRACGACHDDVNFTTGEKHANGLPVASDRECANCHTPKGELEFDASIKGAHTLPKISTMLSGINFEILNVADGVAGKKPTVTFSVKDNSGAPVLPSQMNRLALVLAGPTSDYNAFQTGYVSEDATKAQGTNGVYFWTFNTTIPADAKGTYAIGIEGRMQQTVLAGTTKQQTIQYGGMNKVTYFSVDGSQVQPRRQIVSIAKCNGCHTNLTLHGENRNQIEQCVLCHNPVENDKSVRPASTGAPETVDFRFMIHRIHGGEELANNFGVDFTVYGHGGSKNSFAEVRYPSELNRCDMCHVNGSQNLPLQAVAPVNAPRQYIPQMQPATAACLACHASKEAASHAKLNTSDLGESCDTCHGASAEFSVSKVHASEVQ